jgi:hypothetical protein
MSKNTGSYCPLINKTCIEHKCAFYTIVQGQDPQTGAPLDRFACAIALIPILQIEQARQVKGNSAAIDSLRNETVKRTEITNSILLQSFSPLLAEVKDITHLPPTHNV